MYNFRYIFYAVLSFFYSCYASWKWTTIRFLNCGPTLVDTRQYKPVLPLRGSNFLNVLAARHYAIYILSDYGIGAKLFNFDGIPNDSVLF